MNDLDRKILEIRGWRIVSCAHLEKMLGREMPWPKPEYAIKDCAPRAIVLADEHGEGGWSTSDAKAFELVDELTGQGFGFIFAVTADGRCNAEFQHPGRLAKVDMRKALEVGRIVFGDSAENTPEGRRQAICRAYIAAVTWMREKK